MISGLGLLVFNELSRRDSNPELKSQNLSCYRYTTRQILRHELFLFLTKRCKGNNFPAHPPYQTQFFFIIFIDPSPEKVTKKIAKNTIFTLYEDSYHRFTNALGAIFAMPAHLLAPCSGV